ncbi:MAG: hypothetical protein GX166_03100 [Clostridiaceae bacterium]|nr:hypothetical protein [Clostridiaceae bacterium]
MTDEELERQLRFILKQINENVNVLEDYIDEIKDDEELAELFTAVSGKTLEEMIEEQNESDRRRTEESKIYFEKLKQYLDEKNWTYRSIDDDMIVVICFGLANVVVNVFVIIEPVAQTVTINTVLPYEINSGNEETLKIMLAEFNSTFRFGSFIFDDETGCLSYYYSWCFLKQNFDKEVFENYLYACLIPPDDYAEIINGII